LNLLDENFPEDQSPLLEQWHIPFRQLGRDVARRGVKDAETKERNWSIHHGQELLLSPALIRISPPSAGGEGVVAAQTALGSSASICGFPSFHSFQRPDLGLFASIGCCNCSRQLPLGVVIFPAFYRLGRILIQ